MLQHLSGRWALAALLLAAPVAGGCGGPEKKIEKEEIRRNADDADRDLDRESDENKDE